MTRLAHIALAVGAWISTAAIFMVAKCEHDGAYLVLSAALFAMAVVGTMCMLCAHLPINKDFDL